MTFNDMVKKQRDKNNRIDKNEKTEEYLSLFPDNIVCFVHYKRINLIKDTSYGVYFRSDDVMLLDDLPVTLAVIPSDDGGRSKKAMDFVLQDEGGGTVVKETRKIEHPDENYMRYEVEQFLRPLVENDGLRI